ncbi:hypothetical protein DSL72_007516 [Monilinia vaccinii-corymbosi]|uniref:CCHC-type domain-containing protein n=1 Tax=Monilinia vaccinii-corymbosi TaxID=61207 RepID=A0A8A3PHA0_9HELO|nr:hypothetical protein DSL72_007516 [Monilinia vaccinii-corymbosi]
MSTRPSAPSQPDSAEAFAAAIANDAPAWYSFLTSLANYLQETEKQTDALSTDLQLEKSISAREIERCHNLVSRLLQESRDSSTPAPAPAINSSPTDSAIPTESAKTISSSATSTKPQLSEKLPDPAPFDSTKSDLDRFITQIQNKMFANSDRFTTVHSRLSYITRRLTRAAAAQICLYNRDGLFVTLKNYQDLLSILERVYRNINKKAKARKQLMTLRQKNLPFNIFYAEFQQLAQEAEMADDDATLVILLEQGLSNELADLIIYAVPPTHSTDAYAAFCQNLKNRRRYMKHGRLSSAVLPVRTSTTTPVPVSRSAADQTYASRAAPAIPAGDPMDLSSQRRNPVAGVSRRERGECFRCGSTAHVVRDCPRPDSRPVQTRSATINPTPTSISPSKGRTARRSPPASPSRSPTGSVDSGNGARLD